MSRLKHALISMTRGSILDRIEVRDPTIYLTFDDGPDPVHTPELLELLAAHGARATFFLIGSKALAQAPITRQILARGHALGNHSFSHRRRRTMTRAEAAADVRRCDEVLQSFDGFPAHPYRPPWGEIDTMQYLSCFMGWERIVLWSRNSMDYRDGSERIIGHFEKEPPRSGDVILFHDDSNRAFAALEELLPRWLERGFQFAPMSPH